MEELFAQIAAYFNSPKNILDLTVASLGILYLWWEYRACWLVWILGIIMPAIDIFLYYTTGLYGDLCLAVYYLLAAVYGLFLWKFYKKNRTKDGELRITLLPNQVAVKMVVAFFAIWGITYWFLASFTNSNVPITDALTNALSILGMWAMAKKYLQQWFIWILVDVIDIFLLSYKGLPFKALIHGAYAVIGILGYYKWKRLMQETL